jgi:hypothetical protein
MQLGVEVLQRVYLHPVLHAEQQQREQQDDDGAVPGSGHEIDWRRRVDKFSLTRIRRTAKHRSYIACDANVGASTSSAFSLVDGSLIVMRHSVRGSAASVSVAECSSEALSQITTSSGR